MENKELVKALRCCSERKCSECPIFSINYGIYELQLEKCKRFFREAANSLEAACTQIEYPSRPTLSQLRRENIQLRGQIEEKDAIIQEQAEYIAGQLIPEQIAEIDILVLSKHRL